MSAAPAMTSAAPAVTAQDLELEHAELLGGVSPGHLGQAGNVVKPGEDLVPLPRSESVRSCSSSRTGGPCGTLFER